MGAGAVFGWAWLGGARLTRLVTTDAITAPMREWLEARWQAALADYGDVTTPSTQRDAAEARYQRRRWLAALVSCYWCVGLWIFMGETAVAAGALWDTHSWRVLGGPWWWTLPNAALGAHWIYALAHSWLDPAARSVDQSQIPR